MSKLSAWEKRERLGSFNIPICNLQLVNPNSTTLEFHAGLMAVKGRLEEPHELGGHLKWCRVHIHGTACNQTAITKPNHAVFSLNIRGPFPQQFFSWKNRRRNKTGGAGINNTCLRVLSNVP
jgi:hypothetical protein